jgi:hypothetical protein
MKKNRFGVEKEFGIWTLPATMGAINLAAESRFEPAHYDAVERLVRENHRREITRRDVQNVVDGIAEGVAAICGKCGRFHMPPECASLEAA